MRFSKEPMVDLVEIMRYRDTKAAGGNLVRWWRSENSIGVSFAPAAPYTMRHLYYEPNIVDKNNLRDSTVRGTTGSLLGFSANMNSNHLLFRLGDASMISFSSGVQFDYLRWKSAVFTEFASEWTTRMARLGVPLTVEYKFGCDVNFKTEQRSCFAVGGGAYPWLGALWGGGLPGKPVGRVSPYLYASAGLYAGVCMKIRASYIPGSLRYTRTDYEGGGHDPDSYGGRMNGAFQLSLAFMVHSRDWKDNHGQRVPSFGREARERKRRLGGKSIE